MKKLLFLCIVLLSFQSYSQITLTEPDFPVPTDQYTVSFALDMGSLDYATGGAAQTWDFSSLTPNRQDTVLFETTISTSIPITYIAAFNNPLDMDHKATVCAGQDYESPMPTLTFTDVYNFYKLTSSEFIQVGMGATINSAPLPILWTPTDRILVLPANYGDKDTSNSAYSANIPTLGYYGEERIRYNDIDGYGTVITPFGSFEALRVVSDLVIHDTLYYESAGMGFPIDRTETEYKWFANGYAIPVISIVERTGMSAGVTITYIDSARYLGVSEQTIQSLKVSPNPATDFIQLSLPEQKSLSVEVYNSAGQCVIRERNSSNRIDVSSLPAGLYLIRASGNDFKAEAKFIKE